VLSSLIVRNYVTNAVNNYVSNIVNQKILNSKLSFVIEFVTEEKFLIQCRRSDVEVCCTNQIADLDAASRCCCESVIVALANVV